MARVTLNQNLPPKTSAYRQFDSSIEELNRFYWILRSALQHTRIAMQSVEQVTDIIDGEVGSKLNISSVDYLTQSTTAEQTARYSVLVLSVTHFEEYVGEVLSRFLMTQWKPDKTYQIAFRPDELPDHIDIPNFLQRRAIDAAISEVLKVNYRSRFDRICKLIQDFGGQRPSLPNDQKELSAAACEARNCIIHTGGIIDERAFRALNPFLPNLNVGDKFILNEQLLWQFLGALRDSVRAIDAEIRLNII